MVFSSSRANSCVLRPYPHEKNLYTQRVREYIPHPYKDKNLLKASVSDLLKPVNTLSIVRGVRLLKATKQGNKLNLYLDGLSSQPLSLPCDHVMRYGDWNLSVFEYYKHAVETGDLLDFILDPACPHRVPYFWVHTVYRDKLQGKRNSWKEDGLFVFRTKSGEKAERHVARELVENYGHSFPRDRLETPGYFEIYYQGKRERQPDLVCSKCKLVVEVKKRNFDNKYRISHSSARTFLKENDPEGWHAFVMKDMGILYVSNDQIIRLIQERKYKENDAADPYDSWLELFTTEVKPQTPPRCRTNR